MVYCTLEKQLKRFTSEGENDIIQTLNEIEAEGENAMERSGINTDEFIASINCSPGHILFRVNFHSRGV